MNDRTEPAACPCAGGAPCRGAAPAELSGQARISRRAWFQRVAGVVVLWLWPRRSWARKLAIRLALVPQLRRVGAFVIVRLDGREVLLARSGAREVLALPAICPHRRMRLAYDHQRNELVCPEHGSRFARDGRLLKGPAARGLGPPLPARLEATGERILIDA